MLHQHKMRYAYDHTCTCLQITQQHIWSKLNITVARPAQKALLRTCLQNTQQHVWSKLDITVVGPAQKGTIKSSQISRLCFSM